MKKFISIFLLLILFSITTGCFSENNMKRVVPKDLTVSTVNEYMGPDNNNIVHENNICLESLYGTDLKAVLEDSDEVIRGTVKSITYTYLGNHAWTKANIEITESYKGKLKKDNLASVYMFGGYLRLEDYLKAQSGIFNISSLSKDEIKNIVLKQTYNGMPILSVGDDQFFSLVTPISNENFPKGSYERMLAAGLLYVDDDGNLLQEYYDYGNKYSYKYRFDEIISKNEK